MTTREAREVVECFVYIAAILALAGILHVDRGLNYLYGDPDHAAGYETAVIQTLNY